MVIILVILLLRYEECWIWRDVVYYEGKGSDLYLQCNEQLLLWLRFETTGLHIINSMRSINMSVLDS